MNAIIEAAKKLALPSTSQVSRVNTNANEAFKLINKECTKHKEVISVSYTHLTLPTNREV